MARMSNRYLFKKTIENETGRKVIDLNYLGYCEGLGDVFSVEYARGDEEQWCCYRVNDEFAECFQF